MHVQDFNTGSTCGKCVDGAGKVDGVCQCSSTFYKVVSGDTFICEKCIDNLASALMPLPAIVVSTVHLQSTVNAIARIHSLMRR